MKYEEYEVASKRAKEFGKILEHKKGVERVLEKLDSDDYKIEIKLDFGDCSSYKLNLSSDDEQENFIKKEMYCAFRNIKNKLEEKVTLEHEVIVEIPKEIDIKDICDCIEHKCQRVYDIADYIREFNGRQIDFTEDTCGETEMLVESFRKCKE